MLGSSPLITYLLDSTLGPKLGNGDFRNGEKKNIWEVQVGFVLCSWKGLHRLWRSTSVSCAKNPMLDKHKYNIDQGFHGLCMMCRRSVRSRLPFCEDVKMV